MERQPHANVEAAGVPGLENAVRLSTGPLNNLAITAEPDSEKGELRLGGSLFLNTISTRAQVQVLI